MQYKMHVSKLFHQCLVAVFLSLLITSSLAVISSKQRSLPQSTPLPRCPERCACVTPSPSTLIANVDCARAGLNAVPKNIPKSTTELLLMSNFIASLNKELVGLENLITISLSGNGLPILSRHSFTDLPSLRSLDLSRNVLNSNLPLDVFAEISSLVNLNLSMNSFSYIAADQFEGLVNLKFLDLSSNNIAGIDREAFKDLNSLQQLYLSNNRINNLEHEWFQSLKNLVVLKLNNNRLTRISNTMFYSLKSLRYLEIKKNQISEIGFLSFKGLTQLVSLDISGNNFTVLQEGTLRHMEKLNFLDLSSNPLRLFDNLFVSSSNLELLNMFNMYRLKKLTSNSFKGLVGLKTLHLSESYLSQVEKGAFNSLVNLRVMDLQRNQLSSLPINSFSNMKSLETVNLVGNLWHCDCMMHWFLKWLGDNHNSHMLSPTTTICQTPSHLTSYPILDALDHHLVCLNANISKVSKNRSFLMGSSATLVCQPTGFPNPSLTWVTPGNLMFHWSKDGFNQSAQPNLGYMIDNSDHRIAHGEDGEVLDESQLNRFSLLKNGSLVVHNIQRGDSGSYRCTASNALSNTTVRIKLAIDTHFRVEIQIMSILVGLATGFGFLFLTLLGIIISLILEHFGVDCPCMVTSPKAKQIRKVLESMETYKSQQLEWLKDNYTCQTQKVKDNCMVQMEKLRESYSSQVEKLRDIRDYGTQQIDRIRDNYYMQVQRVRDYSTSQIDRLRENYVFQRNRVRKFSAHQFIRLRENYKVQQLHLNKLLETLNLESCKTNCNRTESIIFEPELMHTGDLFEVQPLEGIDCDFPVPTSLYYPDGLDSDSQISAYYTPKNTGSEVSIHQMGKSYQRMCLDVGQSPSLLPKFNLPTKRDVAVSTSDFNLQEALVHMPDEPEENDSQPKQIIELTHSDEVTQDDTSTETIV